MCKIADCVAGTTYPLLQQIEQAVDFLGQWLHLGRVAFVCRAQMIALAKTQLAQLLL